MNYKNILLTLVIALALGSCGDDDDPAPTKTDLLTSPTWVLRSNVESGMVIPLSPDDCEYNDRIKFSSDVVTVEYVDDTSCPNDSDESPDVIPYTFDEDSNILVTTEDGSSDTVTVTLLTATELWIIDADDDGARLEAL